MSEPLIQQLQCAGVLQGVRTNELAIWQQDSRICMWRFQAAKVVPDQEAFTAILSWPSARPSALKSQDPALQSPVLPPGRLCLPDCHGMAQKKEDLATLRCTHMSHPMRSASCHGNS